MTTNVIITFAVKPDKRSEFLTILSSVKNDLPKVEGCNGVQVFSDKENTDIFTLVENWDSEEKHQKHISGVVESGNWDVIASYLAEDPKSSYFNKL
jgi:quinol monooxygenase YgiN